MQRCNDEKIEQQDFFKVFHLPQPGKHCLKGVYDGKTIKLYINDAPVNERAAAGKIIDSNVPVTVGALNDGLGFFEEKIHKIKISVGRAR